MEFSSAVGNIHLKTREESEYPNSGTAAIPRGLRPLGIAAVPEFGYSLSSLVFR